MKTRKINRAKHFDHGCRNNGPCAYCRSSRTHSSVKRAPMVEPEYAKEVRK